MLCNDRIKDNRNDRHASSAYVLVLIKALGGSWYFLLIFSACSLVGAFMTTAPSASGSCLRSGLTNVVSTMQNAHKGPFNRFLGS